MKTLRTTAAKEELTPDQIKLIYALDDLEKVRAKCYRQCKDDIRMLQDAMHAASRDPPKMHVVVDHVDRVIESMQRTLKFIDKNRKEDKIYDQ